MNEEKKSTDEEKSVDSLSSIENVEQKNDNSASVKEEVMNEEKPKSSMVKKTVVGIGVVAALAILMVIPFGSRTTLGRVLDLVGAHKSAVLMDAFVNRDTGFSNNLARIDINDTESCADTWEKVKENNLKFEAVSVKGNVLVYPGNEEYKESLRAKGEFAHNFSLKDQKVSGDVNFNIDAELSKISEEYQDMKMDASVMGAVDNEKAYFKVNEVKVNLEGMNVTFGLDDWYHSPEFGLNGERKEALNEMAKLITELTETNLSKIVSDETGRQISKSGCDFYDKLEVGGVRKVEFGEADNKMTKKVRAIEIGMDLKLDKYGDVIFDNMDSIVNDDTLHNFIKNDFYDWFIKFDEQAQILSEVESDNPTKEEFGEEFNEGVTEFNENREEIKEFFTEEMAMQDEMVKYEVLEAVIYLEPGTNDYYGYKIKAKYSATDEMLEEIKIQDEKIYSIVKEGIIVEYELYDLKLNDKVEPVEVPENSKPVEEFMEALEDNESTNKFFSSVDAIMSQITGQPSSANYGSKIYQDEMTGEVLYYDGMTGESYKVVESEDGSGVLFYEDTKTGQYVPIPEAVIMQSFGGQNQQSAAVKNSAVEMTAEE